MPVRRRVADSSIESNILKNLIISKRFSEHILPVIDSSLFYLPFSIKLIAWVSNYFNKYKEAPSKDILEIIRINSKDLRQEQRELIDEFIKDIDFDEKINEGYEIDKALLYIRKRSLETHSEAVKALVNMDRLNEAEQRIRDYQKIAKKNSQWKNPFDEHDMREVFERREDQFLRLPGKLGQMIGDLERGWLIAVMGPMKRGKTFWLMEFGVQGILSGYKVAFISAEMTFDKMSERFYKRLTAYASEAGEYIYPVFDCYKNQTGNCRKAQRVNTYTLIEKGEDLPEFEKENPYRICTACRDKNKDYHPASWYEVNKVEALTMSSVRKRIKAIRTQFGDNLRIICYPRFSASVNDIEMDLQGLEYTDGFVPDIIITDYADIFKPDNHVEGREALDNMEAPCKIGWCEESSCYNGITNE